MDNMDITGFEVDSNTVAYVPDLEQLTAKVDADKLISVLRVDP